MCARYFEPAKCSVATLHHSLDIQRLSVRAEAAGWSKIRNGERLPGLPKGQNRPDLVGIDAQGNVVAVEVERLTQKCREFLPIWSFVGKH